MRRFAEVDVFADAPLEGNPLAVVVDADGLDDDRMQRFATWTNFSETTFLLPPTDPGADYRVRIFTPSTELPFAGHPTLGSARVWLDHGGEPATAGTVVQECGIGLVELRHDGDTLAFAAPALLRSGPVDPDHLARVLDALGVPPSDVVAAEWIDNGPGWLGVQLRDAAAVLAVTPDASAWTAEDYVGLVGIHPEGGEAAVELRAFFPGGGGLLAEDPVTGSLNASAAQWLIGRGELPPDYIARQGTALGRRGVIRVSSTADAIWIGGGVVTVVTGSVDL